MPNRELSARSRFFSAVLLTLFLGLPPATAQAQETLDIYLIDVEGGGATLFVSPAGETLLIDTGNGGQRAARDTRRIQVTSTRSRAEQGDADAQFNLGVMYDNGRSVPKDPLEAVRLYRLAAEQGHASAQYYLGIVYSGGQDVPEDDAEAVRWYRLAAEQGLAGAQLQLGFRYFFGEGVGEDNVLAYMWINLAAAQGQEDAQVAEVGEFFNRTPATIRAWIRAGRLEAYLFRGNEYRITRAALEEFQGQERNGGQ